MTDMPDYVWVVIVNDYQGTASGRWYEQGEIYECKRDGELYYHLFTHHPFCNKESMMQSLSHAGKRSEDGKCKHRAFQTEFAAKAFRATLQPKP